MIKLVDWLSWTVEVGPAPMPFGPTYGDWLLSAVWDRSPRPIRQMLDGHRWTEKPGKNFYRLWLHRDGGGCDVMGSPDRDDVLIEISGIGCAELDTEDNILEAIDGAGNRISRIDLAADWLDPCSPFDFAHQRTNHRFRTLSTFSSSSGDTVYIGSMKSDKFARVYRYNPPHPRSDWLRCEMQYKRDQARVSAQYVLDHGIDDAVIAAGNYFGWDHKLWHETCHHDDVLSGWRPDRGSADSVLWLVRQVVPAVKRMVDDGVIESLPDFFSKHFSDHRLH